MHGKHITLTASGIAVFLIPFLGLPYGVKDVVFITLGFLIALVSFSLYKNTSIADFFSAPQSSDTFEESVPKEEYVASIPENNIVPPAQNFDSPASSESTLEIKE